jgi:hypothetical protein
MNLKPQISRRALVVWAGAFVLYLAGVVTGFRVVAEITARVAALTALGFFLSIKAHIKRANTASPAPRPPLSLLLHATKYVPSRKLRKLLEKMLADDLAEISELQKQGESKRLIRWRFFCSRIYWFWYLVRGPFWLIAVSLTK